MNIRADEALRLEQIGPCGPIGSRWHPSTAGAVPTIAFAMKVSHWIFARCAHYKSSSLTFPL